MSIVATKHGIACVVDTIGVFSCSRLMNGTIQSERRKEEVKLRHAAVVILWLMGRNEPQLSL
jgi:hypothetical protein